ncbi:sugar transferase [Leisingera daeponensis]|uniref:sugar transferase n=1 Tax=Leisingera daeponensis TaxID=405746 RepID=UPI001C946689|nr:sugar transferase [Leisingera daeponensis]MBY6059435.1 sugar transferase [Leisingera daeponensis]
MQDFSLSAQIIDTGISSKTYGPASSGFYSAAGKRAFDIALALVLLPFIAPLILVLWFIVRRDGGPGFFGHTRVGKNGKLFKCWKIRSMVVDAEAKLRAYLDANPEAAAEWDRDHKLTNDPRINQLGHILRKTSLDELPQIWNVLKGEMSFVGPRPIVTKELAKYGNSVSAYLVQKPGITGLWQISGRNDISYDQRVALDVAYLSNCNFTQDLTIILKTGSAVLGKTGR